MRTNECAGASRSFAQNLTRRALALLLILAMTLAVFPPIDLQAAAQMDQTTKIITFDGTANGDYVNRPIVINKIVAEREDWETASDGRYKIQITGTPYSVTVQGMTNVDIMFDNVTINRAQTGQTATIPQGSADEFWQASEDLGWHMGGTHYVPTCPFWILDGANVVVSFGGTNNVFKAGSNLWTVANNANNTTTLRRAQQSYYHGYAGIQISGDSSLTIEGGTVEAWGSHQMDNVKTIDDAKRIYTATFSQNDSNRPDEISTQSWPGNDAAGGAGIGGGTSYDFNRDLDDTGSDAGSTYTHATPGNLTINGGNITAIGGFKAAGIGGGVNGAMTSDGHAIIINGDPATYASNRTNVLAIGAFYAAGIGEGDSTPSGCASDSFRDSYELIINGGIVNARGGFKAAGIGTTDELTAASPGSQASNALGIQSGMKITLNGGDITAVSGRADGDGNATAAIGAGDGTNMDPYSISIAEGTFIKASSFSKYAISDKGTDATDIPETVVDPNTYMYLAYYDRGISDTVEDFRNFALYEIKRTDAGDFMVVVASSEKVMAGVDANACYFGYEESSGQFYLVDASGKTLDVNEDGERDYLSYNNTLNSFTLMWRNPDYDPDDTSSAEYYLFPADQHNAYVPANVKSLVDASDVSYYFIEPAMKTFEVPKDYTAVAMTLYDPTLYGGRYILHAPAGTHDNQKFDAIHAVIEKSESGESSGELEIGEGGHFQLDKGKKPAVIVPGNDDIITDETSKPLTDLIVYNGTTNHLGATGATVTFVPGTKSYELWLPLGTTQFNLRVKWDPADNAEVELMSGTTGMEWSQVGNGDNYAYGIEFDSEGVAELWITKTDTKGGKDLNAIRYKVVVRLKSDYTAVLTDPTKTYDGHEIQQGIDSFVTNQVETTKITDELQSGGSATSDVAQKLGSFPTPADMNRQDIQYARNRNLTVNITFSKTANQTDNTVTITTNIKANNGNNPNVSYDTVFKYDENNGTWVITQKPNETFTYNGYTFTVSVTDDQQLQVKSGNYNAVILFAYDISNTPSADSQNTRPDAIEAATEEAKQLLQESGSQMEATSSKHEYVVDERVASSITLSRGNTSYGTATVTKTEKSSGTISVTVARSLAGDAAELLAQATDIRYSYVKIATPSGNETEEFFAGDSLPTNAGTYRVSVEITAPKYEASGELVFKINQKPVTILAIENWRYYLNDIPTPDEVDDPIEITYDEDGTSGAEVTSGAIRYDGVLEADRTDLRLDTVGGYPKMYFADRVAGEMSPEKIIIYANLPPNSNYTFKGFADDTTAGRLQEEGDHEGQYLFDVSGQVSYRVNGAMFGKYQNELLWYKYYPVTDLSDPSNYTNALWMNNDGTWRDENNDKVPDDSRIDYHSPNNQSHAEYFYFHTVNQGTEAARYAVDITYGSLSFSYTKTIWDVNNLHYADAGNPDKEADSNLENVASIWSDPQPTGETVHGKALYSNSILIENRSNRPVWYEAIVQLDFHYTMHKYTANMDEETIKHQDNVLARLFYTYYNESNGIYTMANDPKMVHTGNTGYATTGRVVLPAVTPQAYTSTLTEAQLRDTLPYSLLEMRLLGVPQVTANVGTLTICIYPTT